MQMVDNYENHKKIGLFFLPWLVCFSASLFFFYEFIQGNMFASIADEVMRSFQVKVDKMSYLSSIYYLSNFIFLFIAGLVLDKFSVKKTMLVAMFLCVISTFIFAQAESFYLGLFCRFITGIGSAFCFLGPIRLASRWFSPKQMAMVTGLIVTMAMTGGMIAQYPLTKLVEHVGWREALMQIGWLGTAMLIVMYFGIIEKAPNTNHYRFAQKISFLDRAKKTYLNLQILRAAFYTSLMNMAIAVYGAMMGSLYLMQKMEIAKEEAAVVNSMLFLGAIIGGPIFGWCSDKMGLRILPMKIGVIASFVTILAVLYLPVSLMEMKLLFFLLGFFTASQVISYALVAETNPLKMTATAVSVVSILTQGGYVLYQNLFSFLLVKHGGMQFSNGLPVYSIEDYQFAALIFPLGFIVAWLLLIRLRESHCRHCEEE